MAKKIHEFVKYLLSDIFSKISGIVAKPMFGRYGLFKHGLMFAIVKPDIGKLYFKVDKHNVVDYLDARMQPFMYTVKNRLVKLNYYELPWIILEDKEELEKWVNKAYQAALRK